MKKLTIIFCCLLMPIALMAQNQKFGHIYPEEIMEMLPGFDTAQKVMQDYQAELQAEGQEMLKEFQLKQADYQAKVATYSATVKKVKEDEITAMYARIQEFSDSMEENLNQKKYELLLPFQTKILDAIKEVAKENDFTYIFNKNILSAYESGLDISDKVKQKLGLK